MYIRTRKDGKSVLLREQYNIVEFGPDPVDTYIEGVAMPGLRACLDSTADAPAGSQREIVDDIRVYDTPPYNNRIGSGM